MPPPRAALRDLRLPPAGRGHPPARRARRARRHPLVGPARGLPHRGARADEGPDGQERRDRARRARRAASCCARRRRIAMLLRAEVRAAVLHADPRDARPDRQHRRRRGRATRRTCAHSTSDDPYLVVAADKGTAALSDTANAIALEYGFWLGDAFASGGSKGYDHKALGITARGAWESVKRHFRELGRDVDSRPFTVAGIGDMSGDVFGNGMLLSRQIQLVAAFDHRHVFLDPIPDPAASFAERDAAVRAGRGHVVDGLRPRRDLGRRRRLGAHREVGAALARRRARRSASRPRRSTRTSSCRAILRAPVDLLWNGGIGTFVKASDETHAERRRPRQRRDPRRRPRAARPRRRRGRQPRFHPARPHRVRVAAAAASTPTRSTTPPASTAPTTRSTSRSCSARRSSAATLTADERDALLAAAADEVCDLVLYDNYLQAQILSQEQEMAPQRVEAHEMLMHELELEGLLASRARGAAFDRSAGRATAPGPRLDAPGAGRAARLRQAQPLSARCSPRRIPDDPALDARPARVLPAPRRRGHRGALPRATGCDARSSPRS